MSIIPIVTTTPAAKAGVGPCGGGTTVHHKSVSLNHGIVRFVSDNQAISMVLEVKKAKNRLIIDRWIRTESKTIRKREIVDL